MSLKGKVAIVTGASRGIGREIALTLAKQGAKVAITYVSESSSPKAQDVVKTIKNELGSDAVAIQADSASWEAPKIIVSGTLKYFNTQTIDIIVNNAGISVNQGLGTIEPEIYQKTMDVNVKGPLFLVQEALPYLNKNGEARIVNLSSISAYTGYWGQCAYAAAKAGVEGMTRVMARELGASHNATVNAINPGPVDTDMFSGVTPELADKMFAQNPTTSTKKAATTQDIADIVLFLCEERSRWVAGDVVCANRGGLMR